MRRAVLLLATLGGAATLSAACRAPTQWRLLLTSPACAEITSLSVTVEGSTSPGVDAAVGGGMPVTCGGEGGRVLGDVVVVPGRSGTAAPVRVRVRASFAPAVQGGMPRVVEARRSLRFSGDRKLDIALDPACADVDCNPDPTQPERTCVARDVGGVRTPDCVLVDLCTNGDCSVADAGTPSPPDGGGSCAPTLMETAGPATAIWDFESTPIVPSVGSFPAAMLPAGGTITDGIAGRGVDGCGRFLRCVRRDARLVLAQSPATALPGFAVGFHVRSSSSDVDLLRIESSDGTGIDGVLRIDATGFLAWREVDKSAFTAFDHVTNVPLVDGWQRVEVHADAVRGALQVWADGGADTIAGVAFPADVARLVIVAGSSDLDRLEARALP